jgi:tetrahydromethanopterin S-methyltransferase subunit G
MFLGKEEETFKFEIKKPFKIESIEEPKICTIIDRLEMIEQQVNMVSKYLSDVSQRVSKAVDTSVSFQKDLNNLEKRVESIKTKIEDLESVVPEVEMERKYGKRAA